MRIFDIKRMIHVLKAKTYKSDKEYRKEPLFEIDMKRGRGKDGTEIWSSSSINPHRS